uniref:cAMP responsive element binding protein 3-like 1 n=1 Tax=Salarias fasciatus TaxID=181472 RepID=A0A672IDK1_SALFA
CWLTNIHTLCKFDLRESQTFGRKNSFLEDVQPGLDIQAEHSYSLSEDSAPQSPALSIKMDQESGRPLLPSDWLPFRADVRLFQVPRRGRSELLRPDIPEACRLFHSSPPSLSDDALQLPPTPPSSNHGDSDGSLPPSSPLLPLPPSSPQPQQRPAGRASSSPSSSSAISSSPLLTAPHKLQGSGPLMLTEEEKRTLVAEGYPVPNKLPLTKSEEKALKRVRRKIKNKISAQESRRKKKEYVECLEKKVESYTSENSDLWRKVDNLETANRSLLQQLQKLQSLISGKVVPRACKMASTQTGTCLMMVALCFVLVLGSFSPCISPFSLLTHSSSSSSSSSSPPPSLSAPSADLYTTSQGRWRTGSCQCFCFDSSFIRGSLPHPERPLHGRRPQEPLRRGTVPPEVRSHAAAAAGRRRTDINRRPLSPPQRNETGRSLGAFLTRPDPSPQSLLTSDLPNDPGRAEIRPPASPSKPHLPSSSPSHRPCYT